MPRGYSACRHAEAHFCTALSGQPADITAISVRRRTEVSGCSGVIGLLPGLLSYDFEALAFAKATAQQARLRATRYGEVSEDPGNEVS